MPCQIFMTAIANSFGPFYISSFHVCVCVCVCVCVFDHYQDYIEMSQVLLFSVGFI